MLNKENFKSYIFTGNKVLCSGCGACVQVCQHGALEMSSDSEGFMFPYINSEKCVNCGLCDRICPIVGTNTENQGEEQHCYIATTNEEKFYEESASIGICTMLSNYIVNHGGIVFGAFLDESNWTAYHISVTDEKDVWKIRNSKYLQSSTRRTFVQVKRKLNQGVKVLYIGTPCQIAGLKSFLRKPYSNLYCIDLICHGVFSPKLMPLEVDYWEKQLKGKIINFRFRSKRVYKYVNGGMVNFDLIKDGKTSHIERFAASSPSYRCYAYSDDGKNYNHRLSCYSCPFRNQKRYGDITIGDPWFISNDDIDNKKLKISNSVRSLYIVNTTKGDELISKIKNLITEEEIPFSKAFVQPALQKTKKEIPAEREKLYSLVNNQDYGALVEELLGCNLKESHIIFDKNYRNIKMKRIFKKLIFR